MRAKTRENAPKTHPVWLPVDYPILPSVPCLLPCSARCPISGGWSTRHPATAVPVEVPVIPPAGRGQPADPRGRGQGGPTSGQIDLKSPTVGPRGRGQPQYWIKMIQYPPGRSTRAWARFGCQCLQRPRYGLRADRVALGPRNRKARRPVKGSGLERGPHRLLTDR